MRAVLAFSGLVGVAMAGFDDIVTRLTSNLTDRASKASIQATLSQINGYGCWCMFDGEHRGKAKGIPLDDYDYACRNLAWGYSCAIFDDERVGKTCVPWEVSYNAPNLPVNDFSQDLGVECGILNSGDSCATNACTIESAFIRLFQSYIFVATQNGNSGQVVLPLDSLRHSNTFDHREECKGFDTTDTTIVMDCCGEYEFGRKPYNKGDENNPFRKCCHGQTYLDALFTCCGPPHNKPLISCN